MNRSKDYTVLSTLPCSVDRLYINFLISDLPYRRETRAQSFASDKVGFGPSCETGNANEGMIMSVYF